MIYNEEMFNGKKVGALILIGGEGRRFGSDLPKQFHPLANKPLYLHTLQTFVEAAIFDEILLVSHPDWQDLEHTAARVVEGGATRQESSFKGINAFMNPPDIILIHDGVRPFVSKRILIENVEGAIQWGAVDTCIPSADTLVYAPGGKEIASIPRRSDYLRGQTPQTFRRDWIFEAHLRAKAEGIVNASDDCQLVLKMGKPVHIVLGEERNLKITSEFDLLIAERLCKQSQSTHLKEDEPLGQHSEQALYFQESIQHKFDSSP
jgi:2-C-methyl-D-erythritol 4-phosphate cytidylyltransferase